MENTHHRSTRRKTDLEAVSPEGADCAIEAKYIGVEDWLS